MGLFSFLKEITSDENIEKTRPTHDSQKSHPVVDVEEEFDWKPVIEKAKKEVNLQVAVDDANLNSVLADKVQKHNLRISRVGDKIKFVTDDSINVVPINQIVNIRLHRGQAPTVKLEWSGYLYRDGRWGYFDRSYSSFYDVGDYRRTFEFKRVVPDVDDKITVFDGFHINVPFGLGEKYFNQIVEAME